MVRGKEREDAILAAVIELLGEAGYAALTMDAVAARAQASKATIYRRWRNKAQLVKAALDAYDARQSEALPDTGELRSDLYAVMRSLRERASESYLAMITGLIAAAKHDAELDAALKEHVANEEVSPFLTSLQRAVDRGELAADADSELVHDVAEAMVMRQLTVGTFDDAFIGRVVDDVLLVLLKQGGEK
ncbi:TetR/AcrR family transcriptional regulator [Kutzneria kofuensis]|uniref:AcrR family transcriptional regulator n=1 Tax=Kutzneria kofuensis TaxID=103725 RepID=A0A7W9KTL7_9PSEU|nr:TetR/AcrR family transcriptional regulator [Kutzneria kofuensis]MBB5897739.1 AcrR family transcriptional regulator [Kutzneria kofuensis]